MAYVSLNLGLVKAIFVGVNPPTNTNVIWFNSDDGLHYVYDSDSTSWVTLKGASEFTGLTDVPNSYSGSAGKFAKVNATEDGLEFATVSTSTNLAFANRTSTTFDITSDNGTDATVTAATSLLAGAMIAADKVKMDYISVTQAVNLDTMESDIVTLQTKVAYITVTQAVDLDAMELDVADLTTLTGVASNSTSLGTFTGSTIPDNSTIKASDQALETAVELRISGSGTSGYIAKYTAALTQGDSNIYDTGTAIGIFNAAVAPTFSIGIEGNSARSIGMERHTTAATAGNNFTIKAGGAYSTGTNLAGGNLIASSGIATGTGSSNVQIWTATAGSSGATDRNPTLKATFTGAGALDFESGGFISFATYKWLHYTNASVAPNLSRTVSLGYLTALSNNAYDNTFIGHKAGELNTTGEGNTFIGSTTGNSMVGNSYNTFVGYYAANSATGTSNTVMGQGAGGSMTSGAYNSYYGRWAGLGNTSSGSYNVMMGYNSGASVSTGSYNVGVGDGCLGGAAITGNYNVAVGSNAGVYTRTSSASNTYVGANSGVITGTGPFSYGIVLGANGMLTASNTACFGGNSDTSKVSTFYFGNAGLYDSTLGSVTQSTISIMPGGTYYSTANNMGGHNLAICGGLSTGTGVNGAGGTNFGDIYFKTTNVSGVSSTTLNSLVTRMTIIGGTGYVGMQSITTPTAFLHLAASTTAAASLCIPSGTAPSSPVNGDIWFDGTDLKLRSGGATYTLTKV